MPAAKQSASRKLTFPILQRIRLAHFSLYTLTDTIEFDFDEGIVCLAGANGLGKSTFLQVVGYGKGKKKWLFNRSVLRAFTGGVARSGGL